MIEVKTPVYFMPGMAASPQIFEYIKLPSDTFEPCYLEWILPLKNETISAYALRFSSKIKHKDIVLIGVSFGGVLAQELCNYIKVRKLIIISSVKLSSELPKRMLFAKTTKFYKLFPIQLLGNINFLATFAQGTRINKRLKLYEKYLAVNDPRYLRWAIKEMICWQQDSHNPNIVHIHGEKDAVFPIKKISNCIPIPGGTHIMIINKYKWFNENLPTIILENKTKYLPLKKTF